MKKLDHFLERTIDIQHEKEIYRKRFSIDLAVFIWKRQVKERTFQGGLKCLFMNTNAENVTQNLSCSREWAPQAKE